MDYDDGMCGFHYFEEPDSALMLGRKISQAFFELHDEERMGDYGGDAFDIDEVLDYIGCYNPDKEEMVETVTSDSEQLQRHSQQRSG